MTARIGAEPDMDAYRFIEYDDGYSRLVRQPDVQAMNLHDAAEYRARHARIAHPHYKRHGRIDAVTAEWVPFTADELADMKATRVERRALIGLCALITVCGALAILIGLGAKAGWLS